MRFEPRFLGTILILATFLLAGCASKNGTPAGSDPSGSDGGNPSGTGGTDASGTDPGATDPTGTSDPTTPPANTAPTVNLTASVLNGTAPLEVTFTVAATDAEGDVLSWTLDGNGDGAVDATGEDLPASANVTFAEPGVYTATVNVTDGEFTVNATQVITVIAGGSAFSTLYFVGDGSTNVVTNAANDYVFDLSVTGPGNQDSKWFAGGYPAADNYAYNFVPLFKYAGAAGPVVINPGQILELHVWVQRPEALACGVFAQIFDDTGVVLGTAGGYEPAYPAPAGSVPGPVDYVFLLEEVAAGTYPGIAIHVTQAYIDCASVTTGVYWGSAAHPSRLVLDA